jgi:hypothetical protein
VHLYCSEYRRRSRRRDGKPILLEHWAARTSLRGWRIDRVNQHVILVDPATGPARPRAVKCAIGDGWALRLAIEDKRRTSPVSAVPPPHRKYAVQVVWVVFGKTKDINIEHMLGIEMHEIGVRYRSFPLFLVTRRRPPKSAGSAQIH